MRHRIPITFACLLCLLCATGRAQEQRQVNVSVKIIEFQTTKGVETGLSAYFKQRVTPRAYGRVSSGRGIVEAVSLAFPSRSVSGLTVFLDRLSAYHGDFEVVLQALVDKNRAFILSQPRVMVPVGVPVPTVIKTTQEVPYENTVVVGATTVQTTAFRPTGVTLSVNALQVVDDDGNAFTTDDVYIQLALTAEINEEGQRITVALDDSLQAVGGVFSRASNAISVPEFISRSIQTTVWVRHGQVLILGGLYRNTENKNLATLPWLTQGENMINNVLNRISPFADPIQTSLASSLGNQERKEGRRELVFMLKADLWRRAYTVAEDFMAFEEPAPSEGEDEEPDIITPRPSGFLHGILDSLGGEEHPLGVGGNLRGRD